METLKKLRFLLLVAMGLFQSCQRNEGNASVPLWTIPFPKGALEKHIYVDQPDPDYRIYEAYVRCKIDSKSAELFLKNIGFGPNEVGLTTCLPMEDTPSKISAWWKPPVNHTAALRSKKLVNGGYAQALAMDGFLYIYADGDVGRLKH